MEWVMGEFYSLESIKGGIEIVEKDGRYKDRDWLYQRVVVEGKSDKEIAKRFGLTRKAVSYWRFKHGIEIPVKLHESKDWLHESLVVNKLSVKETARLADVNQQTIRNRAREFNVNFEDEKQPL